MQTFSANTDFESLVNITLPEVLYTRYLRILPKSWENWCGMRFNVLGCVSMSINPRLINPSRFFLPLHKNEKTTDPGPLGNPFYILCPHFDEEMGTNPSKGGGRVGRQSWEMMVVFAIQNSFFETKSRNFEI